MSSYRSYAARDPYWLTVRYPGQCPCGTAVPKGQRTFYYPSTKRVHCPACSERHAADFQAAAADDIATGG